MWIFFIDYLALCINTLRLSYQNANKRQKILLRWDLIFAAIIKIFHRHLGPNLYIFVVKVSPWFHRDFMTYHRHFTTKKHRPRWFRAKNLCAYCIMVTIPNFVSNNFVSFNINFYLYFVYLTNRFVSKKVYW